MNTELIQAIQKRDKTKVESLLPILTLQDSNEGVYLLFKEAMHHDKNEASYAEILQILLKQFPDTEVNKLAAFVDGHPLEIPYLDENDKGQEGFRVYDNIYDLNTKKIQADPTQTLFIPSKEVKKDGVMAQLPQGICRVTQYGIVQEYTKFYPCTPLMIAVLFQFKNMMNVLMKHITLEVSIATLSGGFWDINYDRKTPGVISIEKRSRKRAIDLSPDHGILAELRKIHVAVFIERSMNKKNDEKEEMLQKYEYKENSYYSDKYTQTISIRLEEKINSLGSHASLEERMQHCLIWLNAIEHDSLLYSVLETEKKAEQTCALIYRKIIAIFKSIPSDSFDLSIKSIIQHLTPNLANKVMDEIFIKMKDERTSELDIQYTQIIEVLLKHFPGINLNSIKTDFHLFEARNNHDYSKVLIYDKCTYFMIAHRYQFQRVMDFLLAKPEIDITIPIDIKIQRYNYDSYEEESYLESKNEKYNNYYTYLKSIRAGRFSEKLREAHVKQFIGESVLATPEQKDELLKKHKGVDLTTKEIREHLHQKIIDRAGTEEDLPSKMLILKAELAQLHEETALKAFLGEAEITALKNKIDDMLSGIFKQEAKTTRASATTAPTKNFTGAGEAKAIAINSGDAGPSTQSSRWSTLFK
jgi:hypothetical protein